MTNTTGMPKAMDNLTYSYMPNSNKLGHADDLTAKYNNYTTDIDDQDVMNYKHCGMAMQPSVTQ